MQQLSSLWSSLDPRRRIVVGLAALATIAAVIDLARVAATPQMALLYAGLDSRAAGEVVTALDQHAVAYQVRGSAIYVDATKRDQLRMTLATEGLPATGGAGYELLDNLSGFGTTSQMFNAAYWRAKEGELARSIATSPAIRSARVYISPARTEPFQRGTKPTASVWVTTRGDALPPALARALKYLVASAVAGLKPGDVAIIDAATGLVMEDHGPGSPQAAGDLSARLKRNVEAILEARVGPGKSVVAVNVEPVTDHERIVQKTYDPTGRVIIATDNQNQSSTSNNKGAAPVTVASNLPNGQANAGASGSTSQSQDTSTHERTNYEVSSTERQVERAPGNVRRLTVAVLVDGEMVTGPNGKQVWQPRPAAELATLKDLVASAVGFDQKRGDVITVKSLAFQPVKPLGTTAAGSFFAGVIDPMSAIQLAVLALVALALGLFVVRPILLSQRTGRPTLAPPGEAPEEEDAIPQMNMALPQVLTGEIDAGGDFFPGPMGLLSADGDGFGAAADPNDPVARLRRLIEERQDETLEILKSWVEDRQEAGS